MHMTAATLGLAAATFLASAVEFVEAFTIVLAMGLSRSWRAALTGTAVALLALTAVTAVAGVALIHWVSESVLQLAIGTLLLLFGLQWLRTAILRVGGLATLTCLVDGAAVEGVFRGPDGFLAGGRPGATCIDPTREAVLVVGAEV